MVLFGQGPCIRANVVVFRVKWLYFGESESIWQTLLYWGKKCFLRAKVVLFGQKFLYLGKVVVNG